MQVLGNHLSNAARNSPESSPIQVAVSVSDEGWGISAESLPHLFRMFSQMDSGEQGAGTGLGLAVSKGIVEAPVGRIWPRATGLGARFISTMHTVEQAGYVTPALPAAPSPRSSRRAEQVRVLAVDAPVIFLLAHGQEQLVARALDEGASDYLVKPFSPVELGARVRLALRRRETPEPSAPYVLGDLTIDYDQR